MSFRLCGAAILMLWVICPSANAQATADTKVPLVIHAPVQYPASAVSAREEGTVLIAVKIETDGHAVDARIDKSSGHPDLDAAALQSISEWSFLPGKKNGIPQETPVLLPVVFHLSNAPNGVMASPQNPLLVAYASAIQAKVSSHWNGSKNLPQKSCIIQVVQRPGGVVIHAEVLTGCTYDDADRH